MNKPQNMPTEIKAIQVPQLSRMERARALAIQAIGVSEGEEMLRYNVWAMLHGSVPAEVVTLDELAQWIDPARRWNREAFFWCRIIVSSLDLLCARGRGEKIAREAFKALSPEKQARLTQVLKSAIDENIELFYEGFPAYRPSTVASSSANRTN
jgi:hypothetical protein